MSVETTFRIPDVGRLDQLDLKKDLDPTALSFEASAEEMDEHGELATATAVVIVSLAALKVLAVWLAKQRKRTVLRKTDAYVDTNGVRHETVTDVLIESEMSEPEVLKALGTATNVDVKPLLGQ